MALALLCWLIASLLAVGGGIPLVNGDRRRAYEAECGVEPDGLLHVAYGMLLVALVLLIAGSYVWSHP